MMNSSYVAVAVAVLWDSMTIDCLDALLVGLPKEKSRTGGVFDTGNLTRVSNV
jgi:hypothetical protein